MPRRWYILFLWCLGTALSGVLFCVALYNLVFVLLSETLLLRVYLAYAFLVLLLSHSIVFALKESGRQLSKKIPKYLEYFYTLIVAAGLFQIFVYAPRMADYVIWLWGDKDYIAHQITLVAKSYLQDECINVGTQTKRIGPS